MSTAVRGRQSNGSPAETRQLLLNTAEQLFAERGLDGVSLAEINREAGQRNATALHYHFGGKDGLMQAIFDKHTPKVNRLRGEMLAALEPGAGLEALMPALILPLAEQVRDADGGSSYLVFLAQVMNHPGLDGSRLDQRADPVLDELRQRFEQALVSLQPQRMQFVVTMIFNVLADYARKVQREGFDDRVHDELIAQLNRAASGALLWDSGSHAPGEQPDHGQAAEHPASKQ